MQAIYHLPSWLAVLPHTNKAQNSNPPPNLGLSLWGLHFSLTFQLHGSITHLRTVASITHFNIWSFMTPKELQKILCFKAEAASLLGSQITDEYDYSKLCFHKAISVLTPVLIKKTVGFKQCSKHCTLELQLFLKCVNVLYK